MEKRIIFLEKVFCVLTIIFALIAFILLGINCVRNVMFSILFSYVFILLFLINQIIFIRGDRKLKNRDYVHNELVSLQKWITIIIFICLVVTSIVNLNETIELFVLGSLLMAFVIIYSLQNYYYAINSKSNSKINLKKNVIVSTFVSFIILGLFFILVSKGLGVLYV